MEGGRFFQRTKEGSACLLHVDRCLTVSWPTTGNTSFSLKTRLWADPCKQFFIIRGQMCWQGPKYRPPPTLLRPFCSRERDLSAESFFFPRGGARDKVLPSAFIPVCNPSTSARPGLRLRMCLHHMHLVTPGPTLQPPATVTSWNSACARHLITCADVIKILLYDPETADSVSSFQ